MDSPPAVPVSESTNATPASGAVEAIEEKKGGPIGWFKQKIREKRDESREKERAKSPPPPSRTLERSSNGALNGSMRPMDVKHDDGAKHPTSPVTHGAGVSTEAKGTNLSQETTLAQQVIHPVVQGQS